MHFKSFLVLTIMMLSTTTFAVNKKLNNYEEVKGALLSGQEVRVIVDLKMIVMYQIVNTLMHLDSV